MAIVLWSNFNHGPTSAGDYTNGATEEPVGYLYDGNTRVVAPGGGWGSINALDTGEFWYSGVENTGQTIFNSEEGSMLLLVDTYADSNNTTILSLRNLTAGNGRLRVLRQGTNADISISYSWNSFDSGAEVILASVPTNTPVWVGVIYDYDATPKLQARWWALGGSPGSFTTANGSGSGVPAAFTNLASGEYSGDPASYYLGHIIISNSAADDLAAYVADIEAGTAGYPSAVPNPGVTIADIRQPNSDAQVANSSTVTVVVYDTPGGTELLQLTNQSITSGSITIDNDLVGLVDGTVFIVLRWMVSTDELTYAGTHTVIDLDA